MASKSTRNALSPNLDRLDDLRKKIDQADRALLRALSGRMKTVVKIAEFKIEHGLPLIQKGRWRQLMRDRMALAEKLGLDPLFTRELFNLIHRQALRLQRKRKRK